MNFRVQKQSKTKGRQQRLEVPERFSLSTNFPTRELMGPDADRSVSVRAENSKEEKGFLHKLGREVLASLARFGSDAENGPRQVCDGT